MFIANKSEFQRLWFIKQIRSL